MGKYSCFSFIFLALFLSCTVSQKNNEFKKLEEEIIGNKIFLEINDFKVIVNEERRIEIEIKNKKKIENINRTENPIIIFQNNNKTIIAKGHFAHSSLSPEILIDSEYCHYINPDGKIMLINGNIMVFYKINNERKKIIE
jgi:hypothetical protein